jgi:hypothetical protein
MEILPERTPFDGVPYVGCACTRPSGSDSYPATVVWVSKETVYHTYPDGTVKVVPKKIRILGDRYRMTGGNALSEKQEYQYYREDAPEGSYSDEFSYRAKRRNYVRVGTRSSSTAAQGLYFGIRRAYRDPSL